MQNNGIRGLTSVSARVEANMAAANPPVVLGDKLAQPPQDGISALKFSGDSDLLLAASWDKVQHRR